MSMKTPGEGMSFREQLDEMERRLRKVQEHLEHGEHQDALAIAKGVGDMIDCALCEGVEDGVVGGVLFAAGFTDADRPERTELVVDQIEWFIDNELDEARDRLDELEPA